MSICEYGCGQEANYQFQNGKWCCSESTSGCSVYRKKQRNRMMGVQNPMYGIKRVHTKKVLYLKSKSMTGSKNPMFGNGYLNRITIKKIVKNYPIFYKEEEIRYNPDKPIEEKEIQVHCKNHNCENSKEKDGWFTPTKSQIKERIRQLERKDGNDGSYFYCSQKCKNECILFNLHSDPNKEIEKPYTQKEYDIWKQVVLEQDKYECQKCNSKENLHCHHINPVKTHPQLALDPTNGIVLCKDCHYKIGHKSETECSTGKLKNIICI